MENNEKFYDDEIAPTLLLLCKKCQDQGIPFLASIGYAPGEIGRTAFVPVGSHAVIEIGNVLAQCGAMGTAINIDNFLFWLMKWARKVGHSSIILSQLGVPMLPNPEPATGERE